jgi:hypothetical protein
MKKDNFKTPVIFLMEQTDEENKQVFAYFPKMYHNKELYKTTFTSYAHIGQHSACHLDYAKECTEATESEYKELFNELESIGYNLQILTKKAI